MKKAFGVALATGAVTLASAISVAGTDPGSWYVSPMIQGVIVDDDRVADDGIGVGVAVGKAVSEKWNVELGLNGSNHELDRTSNKLKLNAFDVSALRVFNRDKVVNPYLIAGLGRIESRYPAASRDGSLYLKYGVGVMADIAKNTRNGTNLQLRGEATGRRSDSDPTNLTDYLIGVGLVYSWGGAVERAAPPPPPPPPPPPAPVDGDDDGDGVPNSRDKCPGTPAGAKVDSNGCECGDVILRGVTFVTNSAELTPQGQLLLDSAAAGLLRRAGVKTEIRGHTDDVGSDTYNLELSKRRAEAVKAYLVGKGVAEADLSAVGLGEMQHIAANDSAEGREQNRRVTLQVLGAVCEERASEDLILRGVTFTTGSAKLTPSDRLVLDSAVAYLKARPASSVEVRGHTDDVGNDDANMRLSQARAESVRDYLVANGIEAGRLTANGYGETEHVAPNTSPEGRAQNRRVTLRIKP